VKDNQFVVVEDFTFEAPKTKKFLEIVKALKLEGKKVLLLTGQKDDNVYRSGRNINKMQILEAKNASTYDLLNNQVLVLQKSAVESLTKLYASEKEVG